jgi:hypothetical protein
MLVGIRLAYCYRDEPVPLHLYNGRPLDGVRFSRHRHGRYIRVWALPVLGLLRDKAYIARSLDGHSLEAVAYAAAADAPRLLDVFQLVEGSAGRSVKPFVETINGQSYRAGPELHLRNGFFASTGETVPESAAVAGTLDDRRILAIAFMFMSIDAYPRSVLAADARRRWEPVNGTGAA